MDSFLWYVLVLEKFTFILNFFLYVIIILVSNGAVTLFQNGYS